MFSVLSFLSVYFACAADGVVTGRVIDSRTGDPLEYVTVVVKKRNEASVQRGTLTDNSGSFLLDKLPYGDYDLSISFVGYGTVERNISLESGTKKLNLNRISIVEEAETLQEVKVTGVKAQMSIDIDKKVFNVDRNIASTGGNASDVLSNIPSVEVDSEGTVSLRGNSAVTVWINGKASGLSAENRAQILEQLPAENIDRIEVITNPSAKYSPEGTAGIINIVLKENRRAGYFGSLQAGVDTRGGYNFGANVNYSSGKLEANASLGYRNRAFVNGGRSDRLNLRDSDTTFLNQTSAGNGNRSNVFTRLGLTWHLAKTDHLHFAGFGMFGGGKNSSEINYLSNMPGSFTGSDRRSSSDGTMAGYNFELGYKHDFSKTANIDFTASYNKWGMDEESTYHQTSVYANDRRASSYQRQSRIIDPHNWEFQLDYTNAFNAASKLEAGYKGTLSREKSPVETFAGSTENNATEVRELFNEFLYNQDIHALYSTYSGRTGGFGYQAGLRAEYSSVKTRSLAYGQSEADVPAFGTEYLSLFPSAFVSYALPDDNELQLNYTRRISRPWGRQLNSFKNITDSTNISFGNPRLQPEYSNAFELNYIKSLNSHIFSLSAYYRTTDDVIQSISYMKDNVMQSTSENIARTSAAGTELVVKNRVFSMLDLTTTVNLFYRKLDGFSYLPDGATNPVTGSGQEDFSWNAKMIANLIIPKWFSFQLTGDYNARQVVAQGYRKANYTLDAGIRKSFNKLSFSISARDLLDSRRRHTVTSGAGFVQDAENWRGGRQVSFTLTYGFGNMKRRQERDDSRRQREQQNGDNYDNYEL
jgi:outer membrane receptor protein involved in Fe transport